MANADKIKPITGRNWATVLYPDSMPADVWERIDDLHISCFVSPLHDHDVDKYGEILKPHYHVMFMFDNKQSANQFKITVCDMICSVGQERVNSRRGYARYLCHMDNPEKYQYSVDDVRSYCGVSYYNIINSQADYVDLQRDILDFCDSMKVYNFRIFGRFCA